MFARHPLAARFVAIVALAVACERGTPRVARVALPPRPPASPPTACESKARADAIAEARGCWPPWPVELVRPMKTPDGASVCLTPKVHEGCLAPLGWTVQLTTKSGESVERDLSMSPEHVALFDFDGDGVQELVLWGPAVQILHVRAGLDEMPSMPPRPSWLAPGAPKLVPATGVRDVDGDGRPDLIFERFFEVALFDWDSESYMLEGPPVVALSRPDGTFSFEDRAVVDRLRRACERVPSVARAKLVGLFESAVCTASSGAPLATIESAYRARCHAEQPPQGVYDGDYMAMCMRGESTDALTEDVPPPVHAWLAAIARP